MRITGQSSIDLAATPNKTMTYEKAMEENNTEAIEITSNSPTQNEPVLSPENEESTKKVLQQAISTMNDMLETNHSASKFMFHEGLERYYVTIVDRDTEEVIKEIPPKRLLDAFYEMQKMLGIIVDEKI
ncbi:MULTISPECIES: flagellar protein FlaG [Lysinibacillus]|uniref:flagellar protein FlaG n=1 Tax=Lysinibacillus TaxID=400634 RepID=UPI00214CA55A|nr:MULTISPECIES: flagellar protein FlaG [Lysinibacillus]UUV25153.1 flagellar protein FlaG [Lysinibacillus sp. FN11]UYB48025.1 flagellar protein FlaG [Lysinibacillus capsici]